MLHEKPHAVFLTFVSILKEASVTRVETQMPRHVHQTDRTEDQEESNWTKTGPGDVVPQCNPATVLQVCLSWSKQPCIYRGIHGDKSDNYNCGLWVFCWLISWRLCRVNSINWRVNMTLYWLCTKTEVWRRMAMTSKLSRCFIFICSNKMVDFFVLQANCSASVYRCITINHSNSVCSWGVWSLNYLQSNSLRISLVFSAISHLFSTMSVGISLLISEGSLGCLCDLHRARIVSRAQSTLADPNHPLPEHLRPLPSGRRFVVLWCGASRLSFQLPLSC